VKAVGLRFEREGSCPKGKHCDYSHEESGILHFRPDIAARLNVKQGSRARRLAPNSTSKVHSLEAGGDSEEDDQVAFNIISQLLRVTQDTDGWKAFHKPASVALADGRQVDLQVALFDT
jgi:hypothetical protein